MKILRLVVALVAGAVVGFVIVMAIQVFSSFVLYPAPEGVELDDHAAMAGFVASLPLPAFILVLVSHGLASFAAAAVCTLVARRRWFLGAALLAEFFLLGGVMNLVTIPHPAWFMFVDILLYVPCALIGCTVAGFLYREGRDEM